MSRLIRFRVTKPLTVALKLHQLEPDPIEDSRSPYLVGMERHWKTIFPAWLKGRGWVEVTRNCFPKGQEPGVRTVRRLILTLLESKGIPTTRKEAAKYMKARKT